MSSKTQQKLLITKKENILYANMSKTTCFVYSFCPFDDAKVDIKKAPEAGATDY